MKSQLINYEVALALITALSLIAQVNAQASCNTRSPQCCWVVRLWELMKAATTVSSSSATACCSSPGRIPGVVCSGSTVLELNWGNLSLKNSIPSDIGKLVNLRTLNLTRNNLTGSIPTTIGALTSLQYLDLQRNKLTGSLPTQIGSLTNLIELYIGMGSWLTVTHKNQLTGPIPTEIGSLTNLRILCLGDNKFNGSIPESIGNLVQLRVLELTQNQLTGPIPSTIGNLINLESFYMNSNSLSGPIPTQIGNLANLEYIGLYSNQLTGSIPSQIGALSKLKHLWLHYNQLTGSIPSAIGQMASLEYLVVYNNPGLTGEFYRSYCKLNIIAVDTNLFICGEAAKSSPPTTFSTAGISLTCASTTGTCSPLVKRAQVQHSGLYPRTMSCNYDDSKNPNADCFQTLTYLYSTNTAYCKRTTDDFFANFGPLWKDLRTSCARWVSGNSASSPTSNACISAKAQVIAGAKYRAKNGQLVSVSQGFLDNLSPVWALP